MQFTLDLDSYGGNDSDSMFPLFYKEVARQLASKLALIYRHLVSGVSFPTCWRLTDVVPVAKGSASSVVGDYSPISIILALSKVLKKL